MLDRMFMGSPATQPPPIGSAYEGGYYAGTIILSNVAYYLIVAPKATGETTAIWSSSSQSAPGGTRTLHNGLNATNASLSLSPDSYPAAKFCRNLTIGGYTDWYMPARDELELCYRNLKPSTTSNATSIRNKSALTYSPYNDLSTDTHGINRNSSPVGAAYTASNPARTSVVLFQSGQAESFGSDYWCSSENSLSSAWIQYFSDGAQWSDTKTITHRVRAVRKVLAT